jgi:hypothetical protein
MNRCVKCGFPEGGRPGVFFVNNVCSACINSEKKKEINFKERQEWLTQFIKENKSDNEYDCLIAVSGGKDSHMIVKRLMENHGIKNPLLVTTLDEYTQTEAGKHNLKNIAEVFDVDHIYFRYKPKTCVKEMLEGFENELNPLKLLDERMVAGDGIPMKIAKKFGINLVFYGESNFEYGTIENLDIFHPMSDDKVKYIFIGAIYPYSIYDSYQEAKTVGFKDLDDCNEWNRQGTVENFTQIDSIAYLTHQWCKFVKFGAQRTTDIACRLVRENKLTRDQAILLIKERDFVCDPMAKRDFCRALNITEEYFDKIVDKHANDTLVKKDIDGVWKLKEFIEK